MKDIVSQFAMQLTLAEKRELVAELKGAIAEELASRASGPAGPSRCPRCGSPSFVRKGRDRDGGQRWLCRGRARTFSARTRGLLASSKLPASAWCVSSRGFEQKDHRKLSSLSIGSAHAF